MTTGLIALATYLVFNIFVFSIYWKDKRAARRVERRTPESTLLWLALIGGSLGAVTAQQMLRHKTRKEPFRSLLLAIVILNIGLAVSLAIMPDWPLRLLASVNLLG
mgnify:CR=1 FL=1